ncbi:MAG TPA: rRNA adenine methyltransferase [Chitinophagaceae bacterium]|jgi:rifampin ADP-ribosylating transferase
MQFDPNNNIIQLCARGMELEANQKPDEAQTLFLRAWDKATNDFEKFTAAHYVARHQKSVKNKLKWDETALTYALKINDDSMRANYPSLYLNIAKCYEDLNDIGNAQKHYHAALSYSNYLPENDYGQMIKSGISKGIERLSKF